MDSTLYLIVDDIIYETPFFYTAVDSSDGYLYLSGAKKLGPWYESDYFKPTIEEHRELLQKQLYQVDVFAAQHSGHPSAVVHVAYRNGTEIHHTIHMHYGNPDGHVHDLPHNYTAYYGILADSQYGRFMLRYIARPSDGALVDHEGNPIETPEVKSNRKGITFIHDTSNPRKLYYY